MIKSVFAYVVLVFAVMFFAQGPVGQRVPAGDGACGDGVKRETFVQCVQPYQYDSKNKVYTPLEAFHPDKKFNMVGKPFQPYCNVADYNKVQDNSAKLAELERLHCEKRYSFCLEKTKEKSYCESEKTTCLGSQKFSRAQKISSYCEIQAKICEKSDYSESECKAKHQSCISEEAKYRHNLTEPGKVPYLFYYAIDTAEPYLRSSIDYELRSLKQVCTTDYPGVYWFAVVNSYADIVNENNEISGKLNFIVCNDKVKSNSKERWHVYELDSNDAFTKKITTVKTNMNQGFSRGAINSYDPGIEEYEDEDGVKVKVNLRHANSKYGLSDPNIFIHFVEKSSEYFPKNKYTSFVHIKSHGSTGHLMTGLTPPLEKKKVKCQKDGLEAAKDKVVLPEISSKVGYGQSLSSSEEDNLFYAGLGYQHMSFTKETADSLGVARLGVARLGAASGLGTDDRLGEDSALGVARLSLEKFAEKHGLGVARLGVARLGVARLGADGRLGRIGLGIDSGLGVGGSRLGSLSNFGFSHLKLPHVLQKLYGFGTEGELGFLMFESCDTNFRERDDQFDYIGAYVPNVRAFYSAKGSLWFRNLNWDELLVSAAESKSNKGQSAVLQELVLEATSNIPNYFDVEVPDEQ